MSIRRRAGICLHVTSLPGDYGIGEIGSAARAFVRRLDAMGMGAWQFLPTGPTGFGNSPYQPLSVFAGNELLIDIGELIADGLIDKADAASLTGLPAGEVGYARLIPARMDLLRHAARKFESAATAKQRAAFDAFLDRVDDEWLHDYALFRVLKRRYGGAAWQAWDVSHRRRHKRALRKLEGEACEEIRQVKILQFLFETQWQALAACARDHRIALFGDMPIYVAADSADAWARPDLLWMDRDGAMPEVAGVPPDYFDADGQRWGNPLYRWKRHAKEDYRWWVSRMRRAVAQSDIVRIDHFRGFESYWAVSANRASAKDGHWVAGPGVELFEALERRLGSLPVVAEDLGEITPAVAELRRRIGAPGMRVLQFELVDDDFDPSTIERDCACYTGTHDNNTTRGWFRHDLAESRSETETRRLRRKVLKLTGGSAATIHHDMFRFALDSDAMLAITTLQDLLGLGPAARLNVPGTAEGNWRWRFRDTDLTPELVARIAGMVEESGRSRARTLPATG